LEQDEEIDKISDENNVKNIKINFEDLDDEENLFKFIEKSPDNNN
jgi:hypothetical protein